LFRAPCSVVCSGWRLFTASRRLFLDRVCGHATSISRGTSFNTPRSFEWPPPPPPPPPPARTPLPPPPQGTHSLRHHQPVPDCLLIVRLCTSTSSSSHGISQLAQVPLVHIQSQASKSNARSQSNAAEHLAVVLLTQRTRHLMCRSSDVKSPRDVLSFWFSEEAGAYTRSLQSTT
jgi:hypothetical protein